MAAEGATAALVLGLVQGRRAGFVGSVVGGAVGVAAQRVPTSLVNVGGPAAPVMQRCALFVLIRTMQDMQCRGKIVLYRRWGRAPPTIQQLWRPSVPPK